MECSPFLRENLQFRFKWFLEVATPPPSPPQLPPNLKTYADHLPTEPLQPLCSSRLFVPPPFPLPTWGRPFVVVTDLREGCVLVPSSLFSPLLSGRRAPHVSVFDPPLRPPESAFDIPLAGNWSRDRLTPSGLLMHRFFFLSRFWGRFGAFFPPFHARQLFF